MTVSPRGYNLILAENVPAGLDELRAHAKSIGLIVIDSGLANSRSVERMAPIVSPEARLIYLHKKHTTADLASLLLDSIQN